jgi:phage tail tape-measure protein
MKTAEVCADRGCGTTGADVWGTREEPVEDRALSFATMGGAIGGALAGGAFGAAAGATFPVIYGGLGTLVGSVLLAGGWWLVARLWAPRAGAK